jgi:hypothetical protein
VQEARPRNRRVECLIITGWFLIVLKSIVVWWACMRYAVPFHPLWLIAPTVAFGALCTAVYWFGRR